MPVQTVIQTRRDTAANWTSANPTLAAGEIGFETDTLKFKIGNGSTAWTSLAYQNASGAQGLTGSQGTTGTQGATGAQGTTGSQGFTGSQGTIGTQGPQGTTGIQGATGSQGTTGVQGTTGSQGTQGLQGTQGIQGTKPAYSVSATAPTASAVGETWYDTESGKTFVWYDSYWVETSDGISGIQGIQGPSGAAGGIAPSDILGGTSGQAVVSNGTNGAWTTLTMENMPDAAFKKSVLAATVGSNITLSGGAPNTLDGVTLALNDRVLVKDQTTASQNGIYYVSTLGTGSNGTWTRTLDSDTASEISGATIAVDQGAGNGGLMFRSTFESTDTLGTTSMYWYPISNTGFYSLSAVRGLNSVTTAQSIFNVAFSVNGSTTYAFEGQINLTTGNTGHNVSFHMAATTATLTSSFVQTFFMDVTNAATASGTSRGNWATGTSTGGVLTALVMTSGTSTTASKSFYVRGYVRVNAAGTLNPQLTFSAAPGGTNEVGVGSWFTFTPIGHSSVTKIGPWA